MRTAKNLFYGALVAVIGVVGCQKTSVEGPGGKKLTLIKPTDQTIQQGETDQVMVRINRDNFRDAVTIRFEQLPNGIEVQDKDKKLASDQNSASFTLKAAADAAPVEKHQVAITVEGPDGMKATEHFYLTVKANADAKPETKTSANTP